jgi:hypothetical protein
MRMLLAAVLAIVAIGLPSPGTTVARGGVVEGNGGTVFEVAVPSIKLDATYDARLRISWAHHRIKVDASLTIRNVSGAGVSRVDLNTIAARLGSMRLDPVTVDGVAVKATIDDQTILVPLGFVLPNGGTTVVRVRYVATLRTSLSGSNWLFTKANGIVDLYRWLPWVSRTTPFDRPNHGDPFVTPSSRHVRVTIVTDRKLDLATSGGRTSVSSDGLTQVFEATNVRDFTVTAATDYHTISRTVGDNVIRVYYRSGAPASTMLDAAADAFAAYEARLGAYPYKVFKVVQSAGAYGMESPGLIWIPTGAPRANLRYLVSHETAHQWFYSLVGNDQARAPFADEAATDFMARYVTGLKRGSRCSTGRLDRDIYHYSSACYYERIYIQGGNLLDAARRTMGSTAFWAALKGYVADHRFGLSDTPTLLRALDDGTPKDLDALLFGERFPRYDLSSTGSSALAMPPRPVVVPGPSEPRRLSAWSACGI